MHELFPAAEIPDHTLLRPIGRGSYGEVWMARNALGMLRAVKLVWRNRFESSRPFEREFQGIKQFEPVSRTHEGLVDVLHVGRNDEAGYFYYIMELADDGNGQDLQNPDAVSTYSPRTLSRKNRPLDQVECLECAKAFSVLAGALQVLHQNGLVHRDIKPSNIVFVNRVAKLADIGLVTEQSEARSYVGTEGFVPPEGPGSVQADIYALGKSLYEASTGLDRTAYPSLPELPAAELTGHALLELNMIVRKACEQERHNRYTSASALQSDLALLVSGASVKKLRSVELRLKKARQMASGIGIVAITLLTAAVLSRHQAGVERSRAGEVARLLQRAREAEKNATNQLYGAYVAQVRAGVHDVRSGARTANLAAIRAAAGLRGPSAELRTLAATTLLMTEIQEEARWSSTIPRSPYSRHIAFSPDHTILVRAVSATECEVVPMHSGNSNQAARFSTGGSLLTEAGPLARGGKRISILGNDPAEPRNMVLGIWDLATRNFVLSHTNTIGFFNKAWLRQFALGDSRFVLPSNGNTLWIFNLESPNSPPAAIELPFPPTVGEMDPPGRRYLFYDHAQAKPSPHHLGILEFETGKSTLIETPEAVHSIAWAPDGNRILFTTADGKAWTREPGRGNENLCILDNAGGQTLALAMHPFKPWLASASRDGMIRIWDHSRNRLLASHPGFGYPMGFSPDGLSLCFYDDSTGQVRRLVLHEADLATELLIPSPGKGIVNSSLLDVSPRGNLIASTGNGEVLVWESDSGRLAHRIPHALVALLKFLADDTFLIISERQSERWTVGSHSEQGNTLRVGSSPLPEDYWDTAGVTASGRIAVVPQSSAGQVRLTGGNQGELALEGPEVPQRVFELKQSNQFIGFSSSSIRWWNGSNGRNLRTVRHPNIRCAALSLSEEKLLVATWNEVLAIDSKTGKTVWSNDSIFDRTDAGSAAWSPDGSLVAVILDPGGISILNGGDGTLILRLEHPDGRSFSNVTFNPDGRSLIATSPGHGPLIWNLHRLRAGLLESGLDWPVTGNRPVSESSPDRGARPL